VPAQSSFDYAVIRLVPRVERGEFINAGVVLWCSERQFLGARVKLDEARLLALWPSADVEMLRDHLEAVPRICAGELAAGPIAQLSKRERFHWLVSPRSTVVQPSPVHSGLCDDPEPVLNRLAESLLA
jgi:hypothetical protein